MDKYKEFEIKSERESVHRPSHTQVSPNALNGRVIVARVKRIAVWIVHRVIDFFIERIMGTHDRMLRYKI